MAILIVEDEQGIVSFVRRGLESAGYTVVVASDGVDGLAMAMLPDVEMVILDLGCKESRRRGYPAHAGLATDRAGHRPDREGFRYRPRFQPRGGRR